MVLVGAWCPVRQVCGWLNRDVTSVSGYGLRRAGCSGRSHGPSALLRLSVGVLFGKLGVQDPAWVPGVSLQTVGPLGCATRLPAAMGTKDDCARRPDLGRTIVTTQMGLSAHTNAQVGTGRSHARCWLNTEPLNAASIQPARHCGVLRVACGMLMREQGRESGAFCGMASHGGLSPSCQRDKSTQPRAAGRARARRTPLPKGSLMHPPGGSGEPWGGSRGVPPG